MATVDLVVLLLVCLAVTAPILIELMAPRSTKLRVQLISLQEPSSPMPRVPLPAVIDLGPGQLPSSPSDGEISLPEDESESEESEELWELDSPGGQHTRFVRPKVRIQIKSERW